MDSREEIVKDLKFQVESVTVELAWVMAEIERLERKVKVTQIELNQLQYKRRELKSKKLLLKAEIFTQNRPIF